MGRPPRTFICASSVGLSGTGSKRGPLPSPPVALASPRADPLCPTAPGEKEIGRPAAGMGAVGVREAVGLDRRASRPRSSRPGGRRK
eukprot:2946146-Pyramimonas_sp.AAC.1